MVFDEVRSTLASQFEIGEDEITPDTNIMEELGADSLDVVELMMSLEEAYGIVITDESVNDIKTVNDVVVFIEKQLDELKN